MPRAGGSRARLFLPCAGVPEPRLFLPCAGRSRARLFVHVRGGSRARLFLPCAGGSRARLFVPCAGVPRARLCLPCAGVPASGYPVERDDYGAAHATTSHLRLPDERARLRADLRSARGGRLRPRGRAGDDADVVVFNTCAVRENADNRLYGNLGHLRPVKDAQPGMQIAVGGCLAQKDRGEIVRRAPWVDVVFGTHNIGSLPVLLERARHNAARRGRDPRVAGGLPVDAADPARVDLRRLGLDLGGLQQHLHVLHRAGAARQGEGPPPGRRPGRGRALVAEGVLEVTLLGQNVNSYGVEFGDRLAFGKLLRACGDDRRAGAGALHQPAPEGLHRRRDRGDGRDARTSATACTCRCSPAPTRCCKAMRRSYRSRALPRHHRQGTGGDAGRGDHHRHHRRLPGRDRGRLPVHPGRRPGGPVLHAPSPSSTPSAPARRPPPWTTRCPRRSCRSGTSG